MCNDVKALQEYRQGPVDSSVLQGLFAFSADKTTVSFSCIVATAGTEHDSYADARRSLLDAKLGDAEVSRAQSCLIEALAVPVTIIV